MSLVSPDAIRSEQHAEIGKLIASSLAIILQRWSQRAVEEQPQARRVHHDVLLDDLKEFLQKLGHSLAASEADAAVQYWRPAAKHGEQRWDVGWSLPEVIRDYQILRLILLEFLEERLERALRFREVLAISLALDESITASVVGFIQERDEHLATLENQRLEELRQAQRQLQLHAENLQQADHKKNEFLAILAHELRNPLAPVRHAIHVLKLKNLPDPDLQWASAVIERQAQHLARMVDDLYDISRIAHGKVKLEKQPTTLGAIVERAVEDVQPTITANKHQLTVVVPDEPIWLDADPQRLTQVLVNLLINAAKYTEQGGRIDLRVERAVGEAILRVRDTGIGIPADLLQRIFEPFTQEQQSRNRVQGGLGIGLALVRKLIELHGGRVQALSAGRGQGSEFILNLPTLSAPPLGQSATKTSPSRPALKARILVVDDNRDAAQSLAVLLTLIGHEVEVAHDGPTAIELARAKAPQIILLDIGMPRMDGLEVGRRLRQDLGLTDVVLVALTGYGQDQDRERTREAGFNVHLVKPVELSHLYDVLRQVAEKGAKETAKPETEQN